MKTKAEIEKKLQDLEALILNLREELNSDTEDPPFVRRELIIIEHQAIVLKWVLE